MCSTEAIATFPPSIFQLCKYTHIFSHGENFQYESAGQLESLWVVVLCCQFPLTPNHKAMAELQDGTLDFEARLTLVSSDVRKLQEQLSEITLL